MLHVFIKEPYVKRYVKEEKMPIISYIANIGGLLGLWLGFSIITWVEMLYHVLNSIISIIIKAQDKDTTMAENNVEIAHNPRKANMVQKSNYTFQIRDKETRVMPNSLKHRLLYSTKQL